jgi:nicotinate-nucleotide adenylyltransferase
VERLGILGGTFDPVHVAHLAAACEARHQLGLSRVLLVVACDPWQKRGTVVAPADARLAMVEAAVDGVDGLEASSIEIDRGGPTYTIDTVDALAAPDRELFMILGSDVAHHLDTWHRVDELRARVTLAIVDRDGDVEGAAPDGWRVAPVRMPRLDVSSTDLRRRVAAGEPVEFLVPLPAVRVLRERCLYTSS